MFSNKAVLCVLLWCILSCAANRAYTQDAVVIHSRDFGTLHEISLRESLWFFHAGELPKGKQPVVNTSGWDTLHHTAFGKQNPPPGWRGIGWFGVWVKVDTDLVGKKMCFRINHDGASEIFLDGKPIGGFGKVGHSAQEMEAIRAPRDLIPLWFNDTHPHLIAIRYSNYFGVYPDFLGFEVLIGDYETLSKKIRHNRQLFGSLPMSAAAEIILGLLHFLLFLFYPRQKLNLYYAFFVLLLGINGICVYLTYETGYPSVQYFAEFLSQECKVLLMLSGVMLLYVLDYGRPPRWRTVALSLVSMFFLITYLLQFLYFFKPLSYDYFSITFFICMMDSFWSVYHLIRRRQKGVWLIATGAVAVMLVYFLAWSDVFHLWTYELNAVRLFAMSAGGLVLPLCLSLYLALDFARTNQSLAARLAEVESLSALALAQETEKTELISGEAKRLEEIVQQRTAELSEKADKLREMDLVKSRFFTNITHEFKTPLTLIINPAKELLSGSPDEEATLQHLRLILSNASRLLQLINQLLDLSKLESGLMEINTEPIDLVALIRMHSLSYESLWKQKGITLHFTSDRDTLWMLGDRDKLDKIILNILSNAIKFTDKGKIEVLLRNDIEEAGNVFVLAIRDTGQGIPAAKLPYVFDAFYQADPSDTRSAEGTGIGLALTKELVELMGGQISAESMEGLFTEINISMPYQAAEAAGETILETDAGVAFLSTSEDIAPEMRDDSKPLVLLIEDHLELRDFIHQSLADKYRVLSAAAGDTGITLGLEHIPNLIITDLMMPGTDGYQVCTTLKNDERTSHIPIIILTAKADIDSRVQGIETGADAYLGKPFDKRELFALIENLINMRNQLREHYSRDPWFSNVLSMPTIEQDFMARVRSAIESHLDEEGYSADQLARDIGLSRTQLHRKLKALVGQAPGELIRIVRLQYAHDLLRRRVATVAEVAYMVGFSSPASFSTSFSRHFGFAPKTVDSL